MTATLSIAQLDAIGDAKDDNPDLEDLTDVGVAKRLKAAGDPLFADWGEEKGRPIDGGKVPRAPKKKRKTTRTSKAEAKPVEQPEEVETVEAPAGDDQVPELDTGAPAEGFVEPQPAERVSRHELAKHQQHEVSTHHAAPIAGCGVEGLEGVDVGNLQTPSLRWKTPQTKDPHGLGIADVPDGQLYMSTDPADYTEERLLAFLDIRQGRSFLLEYEDEKRAEQLEQLGLDELVPDGTNVICSSPDRRLPVARNDQEWGTLAESCDGCEFSEWKSSARTGRRVPPPCGENFRAIVVDLETMTPARMFFKGSAIRPMRSLLTSLSVAARRFRTGTYGLEVSLRTKLTPGNSGNYYVPVFGRPQQLEPELAAKLGSLRAGLVAENVSPSEPVEGEV